MSKSLVFTVLVFVFGLSNAQDHEKWIELHGSFENTRFNPQSLESEGFQERLGHSDGLNFQYFLNEKLSLISGLNLTSVLYKTGQEKVFGYEPEGGIKFSVHSSTYIYAPVMLGFQIPLGKKVHFAPRSGLQLGVPIREKRKYFYESGQKYFISDYSLILNHLIFNATLAGSFEFLLKDNFRISLMPFFTKRLNNRSSSIFFDSKSQITYGLRANLKVKL